MALAFDATVRVLYVADANRDSVTTIGAGETVDALVAAGEGAVETAADALDRDVDLVTEVLQGDPH